MTKSEVIAGLEGILFATPLKDRDIIYAAITFLEQEREVMGEDEIEKIIAHELYVRFGWRKNATAKSIAKALSNHIAKPLPSEPEVKLPEEIDNELPVMESFEDVGGQAIYNHQLQLVIKVNQLVKTINALIRYLRAKEGK